MGSWDLEKLGLGPGQELRTQRGLPAPERENERIQAGQATTRVPFQEGYRRVPRMRATAYSFL